MNPNSEFFLLLTLCMLVSSINCNQNYQINLADGQIKINYIDGSNGCRIRRIGAKDKDNIVCECTRDYCDNFLFEWPMNKNELLQVESSKAGKRFTQHRYTIQESNDLEDKEFELKKVDFILNVDVERKYQTILGWGGAFTDATVINLAKLRDGLDEIALSQYFGPNGLQYTMGRIPISGSDFSERNYSYDDTENNEPDMELKNWKLAHEDIDLKIPYIKKAQKLLANGTMLKLFGSSWSPPSWMKTSQSLVQGHLIGPSDEKGEIYRVYAKYLIKFLDAYAEHGVNLWGMTVQNEPISAMIPGYFFNSLQMSAAEQRDFVKYHLGPLLHQRGYTKDKFKLIIGDDSVILTLHGISELMKDEASKYVSGIGSHWYLNNFLTYGLLDRLYNKHKDQVEFFLSTEACTGWKPIWKDRTDPGAWNRGVAYAEDIMENLNRNFNGWIDWNMVLDLEGNPNWSQNQVDSPILIDFDGKSFFKNPMYYALGHFTRFLVPGSQRVHAKLSSRSSICSFFIPNFFVDHNKFMVTATQNPKTNHVSIVVLNKHEHSKSLLLNLDNSASKNDIELDNHIKITNGRSVLVHVEPQSISTFVYYL